LVPKEQQGVFGMTHTFFENNTNYHVEETRGVEQFTVEIAFAPDDTQLDLLFDTDADYYPELIENLESGFWQHMMCRVQAKYDGKVLGEAHLGSVIAENSSTWNQELGEQVNELIDEAVDQARTEAVRMLDRLKNDFLV
jgi:hypothetical protein